MSSSSTTTTIAMAAERTERYVFDDPVTVQVFYTLNYDTWEMTIKIKAVQMYANATWSLQRVLDKIGRIRNADKTVWTSPSNPVTEAIRMASPNIVGGPNLTPCCEGVQLELERVQSPIPVLVLNYV